MGIDAITKDTFDHRGVVAHTSQDVVCRGIGACISMHQRVC